MSRQPAAPAPRQRTASSAPRLRVPRARYRRARRGRAVRRAADRRRLHDDRRHRSDQPLPARDRRRHLPAAADDPDGRDAAGDRALRRGDAVRRVVARLFLRRQHRRARSSDACSRAFTCCGSSTCRPRRSSPWRSTSRWRSWRWRSRASRPTCRRPTRRARGPVSPESRLIYVGDCAVGHDGARRRGRVDAHPVAALRRDDVYVLADPGGVPRRPGRGQHDRVGAGAADRPSAPCARLVPAPAVRHHRVGRACDGELAAVLADQSVALDQPDLQFPARSDARHLGAAAVDAAVGRQLSACARRGGAARAGSGAARRRRLCRQHRRRHHRRARHRAAAGRHRRQPGGAADPDRDRRDVRGPRARRRVAGREDRGRACACGRRPSSSSARASSAVVLARAVPPLPGLLVAYGRYAATWVGINQIVYVGEGITAAVAVSRTTTAC